MANVVDRSKGVYWRFMWSNDWKTKTPWTMQKRPTKYIGKTVDPVYEKTGMYTFGPLALVFIDTREEGE